MTPANDVSAVYALESGLQSHVEDCGRLFIRVYTVLTFTTQLQPFCGGRRIVLIL